jgi:MFS family permease
MIGNCLDGVAVSFIFVPLLSEIVDAVKEKENITEENEQLNDLASGLFNTSYAIGCLIAPILGGVFNDLYGFRYTCDIFAFSSLAFAVVYFFGNMVPYLIERNRKKRRARKIGRNKHDENDGPLLLKI